MHFNHTPLVTCSSYQGCFISCCNLFFLSGANLSMIFSRILWYLSVLVSTDVAWLIDGSEVFISCLNLSLSIFLMFLLYFHWVSLQFLCIASSQSTEQWSLMKSPCVNFVNVVLLKSIRTRSRVWPLLWVRKVTWFCRLKRSNKSPRVCASGVLMVSDLLLKSPNINSSFPDVIFLSTTLLRPSKNVNKLPSGCQYNTHTSSCFWFTLILKSAHSASVNSEEKLSTSVTVLLLYMSAIPPPLLPSWPDFDDMPYPSGTIASSDSSVESICIHVSVIVHTSVSFSTM